MNNNKRVFKEVYESDYQIKVIDLTNNTITLYSQDRNIGFVFGKKITYSVQEIGYDSVKDCIKKLKERKLLTNEVDYKQQLDSEKIGFINLGVERIKRTDRINTKDFEDVIKSLSAYGVGFVDAQNIIIESYLNSIAE